MEVVGVLNGIIDVRFCGACIGCPSGNMTLQSGIARQLRERIPELKEVRALNERTLGEVFCMGQSICGKSAAMQAAWLAHPRIALWRRKLKRHLRRDESDR